MIERRRRGGEGEQGNRMLSGACGGVCPREAWPTGSTPAPSLSSPSLTLSSLAEAHSYPLPSCLPGLMGKPEHNHRRGKGGEGEGSDPALSLPALVRAVAASEGCLLSCLLSGVLVVGGGWGAKRAGLSGMVAMTMFKPTTPSPASRVKVAPLSARAMPIPSAPSACQLGLPQLPRRSEAALGPGPAPWGEVWKKPKPGSRRGRPARRRWALLQQKTEGGRFSGREGRKGAGKVGGKAGGCHCCGLDLFRSQAACGEAEVLRSGSGTACGVRGFGECNLGTACVTLSDGADVAASTGEGEGRTQQHAQQVKCAGREGGVREESQNDRRSSVRESEGGLSAQCWGGSEGAPTETPSPVGAFCPVCACGKNTGTDGAHAINSPNKMPQPHLLG